MIPLPRLWLEASAALAVGLAFGFKAPFGTAAAPSVRGRMLYWLLAIGLNWAEISLALALARRALPARSWGPVKIGLSVAAAVSLPASFQIVWLNHYFFGLTVDSPTGLVEIYLSVLLVAALITVPANLILPARLAAPAAPAPAMPAFFERIPPALGRTLIGLEMEDHYLRIHTDRGSDLILCRFGDAMRELDGFDGLQVHRSWYVARTAIVESRKDGQKMMLTLCNGLEVPVSRPFQKALRNAG